MWVLGLDVGVGVWRVVLGVGGWVGVDAYPGAEW